MDVDLAVIDTGVSPHPELNVVDRVDCTGTGGCTPGGSDGNGHGTHVAGSAAAINNDEGVVGVAPGARIWAQKVCPSSSCPDSAIVAGIDYVTAHADEIEVANMSLGGPGTNQAIADAITASIEAGVVYVVAAGNDGQDARNHQPANHPDVVTVSALADSDGQSGGTGGAPTCRPGSQDDHLADFSNWGPAVEVAAPGVCITSTWLNGGYNTISGTSMASPHVAGAAALLTSGDRSPSNKAEVLAIRDTIQASGNLDWIWESQGPEDVQRPLLDVGDPAQYQPDLYRPPVASFDVTCDPTTLACSFDGSGSHDPEGSPITEWAWRFGDGTTGAGATTSHTYSWPRAYTVSLEVTTASGRSATTEQQIVVGDPAWKPAAAPPEPKGWPAGVQCADDPDGYYHISGYQRASVHRYDFSSDSWTELAPYPVAGGHEGLTATCTDDGNIHVMGGPGGGTDHYVYDIATDAWTSAAPVPTGATFAAAAAWDGKVYFVGGARSGLWDATDRVQVYDIATDSWVADAPPLPDEIFAAGFVQSGSDLYVAASS